MKELESCTFKPNTAKSNRTYRYTVEAEDGRVPRGFYENRERLRTGVEKRKQAHEQKEDRMARPARWDIPEQQPAAGPARTLTPRRSNGYGSSPWPPEEGFSATEAALAAASSFEGRGDAGDACIESFDPGSSDLSGTDLSDHTSPPASTPQVEGANEPLPLLFVDVNVVAGQPPQRIVLFEGQTVEEVAGEFAQHHGLAPAMARKLQQLLDEVLAQRQAQMDR